MAASPRRGSFPWKALTRSLGPEHRTHLVSATERLLEWQLRLERWPRITRVPDATPFVSLYARGRLVGCFGSEEGPPGERLARAFCHALEDGRYGGMSSAERGSLTACVSYLRAPTRRSPADLERVFELGIHGLGAVLPGRPPALLLPSVAIDERADVTLLVMVLAGKLSASPAELAHATLFTFEADTVVARVNPGASPASTKWPRGPMDAAAAWLAKQVGPTGRVRFAVDARARTLHPNGEFLHGRAAAVVQALAAHGGFPVEVDRARRWLRAEVRAALRGRAMPPDWPRDAAGAAGTVALAVLAGLDLETELLELAQAPTLTESAWHTAQVVTALGHRAPRSLFRACVSNLAREPWAPWTALAAHALGDARVLGRVSEVLVASIRGAAPHEGAVAVTRVPEVALTALTVEALTRSPSRASAKAVRRATAFLCSTQFMGDRIPASLDPEMAHGAFPLSSVVDGLRSDVTGHALLALSAVRLPPGSRLRAWP